MVIKIMDGINPNKSDSGILIKLLTSIINPKEPNKTMNKPIIKQFLINNLIWNISYITSKQD
jgi:hypothetical protein